MSLASVQLEEGNEAHEFAYEDYSKTLEKCQRFYEEGTATLTVLTQGEAYSPGAFKTVPMKRTKRNSPNIFITVDESTGNFTIPYDIGVHKTDARKFTVGVGVVGSASGMQRVKIKWKADSELPLYNNIEERTTEICSNETACHLASTCKINTTEPRCGPENVYPLVDTTDEPFKVFVAEIPDSTLDMNFSQELEETYGGLVHMFNETDIENWNGTPDQGSDNGKYWMLLHGDGTSQSTPEICCSPDNKSVEGRYEIGLYGSANDPTSNHPLLADQRDWIEYSHISFVVETKHPSIIVPTFGDMSDTDINGNGIFNRNYIWHTMTGPQGESLEITYNTAVSNLNDLASLFRSTSVDADLRATPRSYYGYPRLDLYSRPLFMGTGNDSGLLGGGVLYNTLNPEQQIRLQTFYFERYAPIVSKQEYVAPVVHNMYSSASAGDGEVGNVNNNDPSSPKYSPYFKFTPWTGFVETSNAETEHRPDLISMSKRYGKPVYAYVSPTYSTSGEFIQWGNETSGNHYTTMCNPSCNPQEEISGVTGPCYEGWRCWDKQMSMVDFITTQIKPLIDNGADGVVMGWTPLQTLLLATHDYGNGLGESNPNITQYSIDEFPSSITGPDGREWLRSWNTNNAWWWSIIDNYPAEVIAKATLLGMELPPNYLTHIPSSQNFYNARYNTRLYVEQTLLDGTSPTSGGGYLGGCGWNRQGVKLLLKRNISLMMLYYTKAIKIYAETGVISPDWNSAVHGIATQATLQTIGAYPDTWVLP